MRKLAVRFAPSLVAATFLGACAASAPARHETGHPDSAFAAATGVVHAEGDPLEGGGRIVPLRPFAGDAQIVSGDPEKPGEPFVMRIRELPGSVAPPHTHPVDENITVVQGVWYFAIGETWDRTALRELKAGDYAFAPKGSTMFGYCPDGAVVQVHDRAVPDPLAARPEDARLAGRGRDVFLPAGRTRLGSAGDRDHPGGIRLGRDRPV
jgi:hypothetical protein